MTASDYYALYDILQSSTWAFPGGEEQKRPVHFPPLVPPEEATRLDQIKSAKLAALDTEIATLKSERVAQESKSRTEAGTDSLADSAFKSADCPARRLAEHGVRFLELIDVGSSNNWDSHANMGDHERLAKDMAPPVENRRKPKQFGNG